MDMNGSGTSRSQTDLKQAHPKFDASASLTIMLAYHGECTRKWYARFSIEQRIADHACIK